VEQLKFKRLFLKEDYLGKKKGAEAFIVRQIGEIYGIRFKVTKGCSWCQGNKYHLSLLESELNEKFILL
jgi:hypothetical protein